MNSQAHAQFWTCFHALPPQMQRMAVAKFRLWRDEPFHPSLRFKEISEGLWSARITRGYRALARRKGDLVVWFWIGTHEDYDRLIAR